MWSYYGSKNRICRYYPAPIHDTIIEPFAGAAYYSLRYFEREVILIDKNPVIVSIWKYLQECSLSDITSLPVLPAGHRLIRSEFDCDGQYNLMRFLIVQAAFGGNNIVSKWGAMRLSQNIKRVARHHFKIKHWTILEGDYSIAPNVKATWFIDPPYFTGGHKYLMSNRKIDFNSLAQWSKKRNGQIIVCENTKATWLNFLPICQTNGVKHVTTEAMWTNMPTGYGTIQGTLFK